MRWSETRNWVSIGFKSAKSSEPVRISSLNSSALDMKSTCTMLLTSSVVARKRKNSYFPQPLSGPIIGVYWNTST